MLNTVLKVVLTIAVLAAGAFVAKTIVDSAEEEQPREVTNLDPMVRTVTVVKEDVRLSVTTYGTVRSRTEIQVVPRVSGQVEYVSPGFRDGGFFQKDDVLVRIEREDYELAKTRAKGLVSQAEAAVSQAQARLQREEAEAEVARLEWGEFGKGEAPALVLRLPQLAEAKAAVSSAQAALSSARASLAAAELDLKRTEIRAWFDGRVRQESVEVGQFLMAGSRIAIVYGTDYAEVRLAIPDGQLGFLDLPVLRSIAVDSDDRGTVPVRLSTTISGTEYHWDGVISRTEAEVDPKTRVIYCVARVTNPYAPGEHGRPPLMIGMYLKAEIPGREIEGVALIPRGALRGRNQVLVVDGEDRIRWRQVEIIRKEGTRVLLASGLEAGERVCLTDLEVAIEGMKVRIEAKR